ncbi:MAG TPA: nuclear transport factor 2 family protein [Amycolatopsis sp.]|nr:nuclear transport factor 2 family protein [Amycolatopsis sp.]
MDATEDRLATLIAKDEIRELVHLYSRGIDRRDGALVRSLYTEDGTDNHGDIFSGTADEFVAFLEMSTSAASYTGHHVCNHLIAVDSEDEAHGEVYCIAFHVMLGDADTAVDDIMLVRYLDHYRREHGRWRFASRDVVFDHEIRQPIPRPEAAYPEKDSSYSILPSLLFGRGPRP